MQHHAFVIEAGEEEGIAVAQVWAEKELGIKAEKNPDVVVMRYGLLSVEDARRVSELAAGAAFTGEHKVVIISATRTYHEAQNALLKLFEEPPKGAYLFLIMPTLGGLLPTLRSRVQELKNIEYRIKNIEISGHAEEFIKASKEKRSAMIKKLTSGKDEEERRELRDEAISVVNGIEAAAYAVMRGNDGSQTSVISALLSDIAVLRGHLYDRSAPVRMILEHLSLVIPKGLI
ncbi:MAG: hypothetical protein NUV90_00785 [Candidatus Parcubacteria bacterium]|nr:hypothetical protein [Candidatus Parcubacteria bacterium]